MNKPNRSLPLSGALLFAALSVAACQPAAPPATYFSLLATDSHAAGSGQRHEELALSVGPVVIADVLKQEKIATGGTDGRYRLSESHRWAGEVDREFARAVAEQLADRLGTEQVAVFPWDQHLRPDRRILLEVLAMGGEPGGEAKLAVRWSLIDPTGKMPPVIRRSDLSEKTGENGYASWVKAQQRNIERLSAEIAVSLKEVVGK